MTNKLKLKVKYKFDKSIVYKAHLANGKLARYPVRALARYPDRALARYPDKALARYPVHLFDNPNLRGLFVLSLTFRAVHVHLYLGSRSQRE